MEVAEHTERRVRHLRHPGQLSTINGAKVKREAFRYVIEKADGPRYAYCVEDAVAILRASGCAIHGDTYMAHHQDGSATCGRCYMQRARDLGVI